LLLPFQYSVYTTEFENVWGDVRPIVLVRVTLRLDPVVLWNCHHIPLLDVDWSPGRLNALKLAFVSLWRIPVLLVESNTLVPLTSVVTYRQSVGEVIRTLAFTELRTRFPFESPDTDPTVPYCSVLATVI
jgi:hypothetical protein